MLAKKTIAKRRRPGWSERMRYFRSLFNRVKPTVLKSEETRQEAPVTEKD